MTDSSNDSEDLSNSIQPYILDNVIVKAKLLIKKKEEMVTPESVTINDSSIVLGL